MDCDTGRIYECDAIRQLIADRAIVDKERFKQMAIPPTSVQTKRKMIGRNDPCPCGSGSKFKAYCLRSQSDERFE